jgi:hypothetical protein
VVVKLAQHHAWRCPMGLVISHRQKNTIGKYWCFHIDGEPGWRRVLDNARVYENNKHPDLVRMNDFEELIRADYDSEGIVREED